MQHQQLDQNMRAFALNSNWRGHTIHLYPQIASPEGTAGLIVVAGRAVVFCLQDDKGFTFCSLEPDVAEKLLDPPMAVQSPTLFVVNREAPGGGRLISMIRTMPVPTSTPSDAVRLSPGVEESSYRRALRCEEWDGTVTISHDRKD